MSVKATPTVLVDNERVLITEWRFPPGADTGWHRHAMDYVVVPQTSGRLSLDSVEGQVLASLQSGRPYFRSAGVEHNVTNVNDHEFVFVEIEIRDRHE